MKKVTFQKIPILDTWNVHSNLKLYITICNHMQMYPDKAHDNNYPFDLHIFFYIRMYYRICTLCEYLNTSLTQTKT